MIIVIRVSLDGNTPPSAVRLPSACRELKTSNLASSGGLTFTKKTFSKPKLCFKIGLIKSKGTKVLCHKSHTIKLGEVPPQRNPNIMKDAILEYNNI